MNTESVKCERCFISVRLEDLRIIDFNNPFDDDGKPVLADVKQLCEECFGIVKYAASPESWISTTADTKSKKLYYFDKKQE